jgi:hypothetical protein
MKGKGKGYPMTCLCRDRKKVAVGSYPLANAAREEDGWLVSRSGRFNLGKAPVPIVQEARWVSGPV